MKKKKAKSGSLLNQVIWLSLSACIVSMMVLGIALIVLSAYYFSEQAETDLEFYLESTNEQFDNQVKNMENMVISFRNNREIRQFLQNETADMDYIQHEFDLVTDLYSESNMVGSVHPFVGSAYLFNKSGKWVSSQVYPQTVEENAAQEITFKNLNRSFTVHQNEYKYIPTPNRSFICTRVYDDHMKVIGNCILTIETDAVKKLFNKSERFPDQSWYIAGANGEVLFSNDRGLKTAQAVTSDFRQGQQDLTIDGINYKMHRQKTGFGLQSELLIDTSNIYHASLSMLVPFALIFCVIIGLAGIVVLYFAIRITKPIKLMGEDIRKFSNGEQDGRMREFGVTEFDEISHLYNQMTGEIENLVAKVYEKQLLATQAQVKYLQSQINPHFMFNILSMMSMRAALNGDKELQKMLSAFAKLIQGKIFRRGEVQIQLHEEMELVEFYLLLQSERFSGKITYEIHCDEEVKTARIPRLLIEPMVENAVAHGLEPKTGKGSVCVVAKKCGENLWIQIKDDGVGFCLEELAGKEQLMADKKHTHIGIENARQMLNSLYEDKASMTVESEIDVGTTITITLPLERNDQDVESNDCR